MVSEFKKNKRKDNRKEILFWVLLVILSVSLIGVLAVANVRMNKKRAEYTARIEALRKEIQQVEIKSEELKKDVAQAGSEEQLERIAREQLGLKSPGEEVVVITKEEEEKEEKGTEEKQDKNFWNPKTWWEWIMGE